ncbi:NAD-dependent epimerase/dehydratase family protein [Lysobacter korlensis]|uniref:NAD-dependent epimerase/dehydratase family protein n=1 Tax=Lysobacter korlensis TaxID=553636 RepID=A0ABV6RK37_9GAMM
MSHPLGIPESDRPTTLIAGAGDVGQRLAQLRASRGDAVLALRRRPLAAAAGVHNVSADLISGEGLASLPRAVDAIVFCAAPDHRDEATYRALFVDGLQRLVDTVDARRVVFVSSTAVYGEVEGEWVDEATPARPPAFNGRVLHEAEHRAQLHAGGTALRLSGLYGPGRGALLRRARAGTPGRPHWTNRIHVDDAATALSHLLDLSDIEPVYCGTDDVPALEHELFAWIRDAEGLPPVPAERGPVSGRRVSNARLRASGWQPRHADFRSGYASLVMREA